MQLVEKNYKYIFISIYMATEKIAQVRYSFVGQKERLLNSK